MSQIQRSVLFSAAERYLSLLLFFVSAAVLSRLLTPEEFGIYAVVSAITTVIAVSFQEFGGANYLIQKPDLTEKDIRTAFTITFGLSVLVGAALFFLGGALASLFSQEGLRPGIAIAVLNFIITPFAITISALLRRDMKFGAIAVCNLASNVATVAVSIALAALKYSFLAPIWGTVAGSAVQAVCLILYRNNLRFFLPSLSGYLDVVKFGAYSGGIILINVFYSFAPQLFLARILDFTAVGLYSRAVNVTQIFDKLVTQVLGPIVMPAIFAHSRGGAPLKRLYLDGVTLLSVIQWPFLLFIALMAHPIIEIWLGASWLAVVPLIRFLCVAYLAYFAACLTYPILVAAGSVRDALVASLISLPPSLVIIFIASFFGVNAVAASSIVVCPFQAAVAFYFIARHLDLNLVDFFHAMSKSAIVTLCTVVGTTACALLVGYGWLGSIAGLFLACGVAAGFWLAALIVVRHPLLPHLQTAARNFFSHTRALKLNGGAV